MPESLDDHSHKPEIKADPRRSFHLDQASISALSGSMPPSGGTRHASCLLVHGCCSWGHFEFKKRDFSAVPITCSTRCVHHQRCRISSAAAGQKGCRSGATPLTSVYPPSAGSDYVRAALLRRSATQ